MWFFLKRAILIFKQGRYMREDAINVSIVDSSPQNTILMKQYSFLLKYLIERHTEIFNKPDANRKDYVVALPPEKGQKDPCLKFFSKKSKMIAFIKSNHQVPFEYRYSRNMELMY